MAFLIFGRIDMDDDDALKLSDLIAGQTDPVRIVHDPQHGLGNAVRLLGDLIDRTGLCRQDRIAEQSEFEFFDGDVVHASSGA